MRYAHYYASRKEKIVVISDNLEGKGGLTFDVKSKAEARGLAKAYSAKCWNF